MGSASARDMAAVGGEMGFTLEQQLSWHLGSNHFPPVPSSMIPVCIVAIDAVNEEDDAREIELPGNVTYQDRPTAPAYVIVEQHHLDAWITR